MKFPLSSTGSINYVRSNAQLEAEFNALGGHNLEFRAPMDGLITMSRISLGSDRFWVVLFRPLSVTSFPDLSGHPLPKPGFISFFERNLNLDATARRTLTRNLLRQYRDNFADQLIVETFDDDSGSFVRTDTLSLGGAALEAAADELLGNYWERDQAVLVAVKAGQVIYGGPGDTESRLGMAHLSDTHILWLDTHEYLQRLTDFDVFEGQEAYNFPYTARSDEAQLSAMANPLQMTGVLLSGIGGSHPVIRIRGGLQNIELRIPLIDQQTLPLEIFYVTPGLGPAIDIAYIELSLIGGRSGDWWLENELGSLPFATGTDTASITGTQLGFTEEESSLNPRTYNLILQMGTSSHRVTFTAIDNIIDRAFGIARHIISLKAGYFGWLERNAVSGVKNREAVELYNTIGSIRRNTRLPREVREDLTRALVRGTSSTYGRVRERIRRFRRAMEGNIVSSRHALRRLVFEQPYLKQQIMADPSAANLDIYRQVHEVLAETDAGIGVLREHYRDFFAADEMTNPGYGLSFGELSQIWKKAGETHDALSGVIPVLVRVDMVNQMNRLSDRAADGSTDLSAAFQEILSEYRQRFARIEIDLVARRVQNPHLGRAEIQVSVAFANPAMHLGQVGQRVLRRLGGIAIITGLTSTLINTIEDPSAQNIGDLSANTLQFAHYLAELRTGEELLVRQLIRTRRLGEISLRASSVLGAATAAFDLASYMQAVDRLSLRGDTDAENYTRAAAAGATMIIFGEVIMASGVLAPVGIALIVTGTLVDLIGAAAAANAEDSDLHALARHTIFGNNYANVRDVPAYRHLYRNVPRQISELISIFHPINGQVQYLSAPLDFFPLVIRLEPSIYDKESRLYLELHSDSGFQERFDYGFLLDDEFRYMGTYIIVLEDWLRIDILPPNRPSRAFTINVRLRQDGPRFDIRQTTYVRVVLSMHAMTTDRRAEGYVDTNTFRDRYPYATRRDFVVERP